MLVSSSRAVISKRPPYLSVQIPTLSRQTEPLSTATDVNQPTCMSLSENSLRIGIERTPNINHTAKRIVNANVASTSTLVLAPSVGDSNVGSLIEVFMGFTASLLGSSKVVRRWNWRRTRNKAPHWQDRTRRGCIGRCLRYRTSTTTNQTAAARTLHRQRWLRPSPARARPTTMTRPRKTRFRLSCRAPSLWSLNALSQVGHDG